MRVGRRKKQVWFNQLKLLILGIELLAAKLNVIITTIKKRNYDFLDQRKTDFDTDYDDFKRAIQDLHVRSVFSISSLLS